MRNVRVDRGYEHSDKRRYYVPCPHCQKHQVLNFGRLRWPKGAPQEVRYICEHCEKSIPEHHKTWMLENGEWRAENLNYKQGRVAGFHISGLYSPLGWLGWDEIAEEWDEIQAENNQNRLKGFVNTVLGETWEEKGDAPEWRRLYERREDYPLGSIPKGVLFLTAGVDIQQDRIEAEVIGWKETKESYSIEHFIFPGNPSTQAPWQELDKLMIRHWTLHNGITIGIKLMAVDSGYLPSIVCNWCRKYPPNRVIPVRSRPNQFVLAEPTKKGNTHLAGRSGRSNAWNLGSEAIKSELYSWLRLEKPLDGEAYPPGYCHFPEYDEEYFKQLTSEQLVSKVVNGFTKYEWKKFYRNEVLDMRVYARAAAYLVGLDRFQKAHWDQLKTELRLDIDQPIKPVSRRGRFAIN